MKVVLDTNVFISGIFWAPNFASKVIEAWKNQQIELVTSFPIIGELVSTLKDFKINIEEKEIRDWELLLAEDSLLVDIENKLDVVKDDPDDNKFIETALVGGADYIISQDKHLLNMEYYEGILIVTPEYFLENVLRE